MGIYKERFRCLIGGVSHNSPGETEEYHEKRRVIWGLFRVWIRAPLGRSLQPHRKVNLLACSDGLWTEFKEGNSGLLAAASAPRFVCSEPAALCCIFPHTRPDRSCISLFVKSADRNDWVIMSPISFAASCRSMAL